MSERNEFIIRLASIGFSLTEAGRLFDNDAEVHAIRAALADADRERENLRADLTTVERERDQWRFLYGELAAVQRRDRERLEAARDALAHILIRYGWESGAQETAKNALIAITNDEEGNI